ncbi:hypothetical protein OH77DRAFT_1515590 [Trametes cingulata]|nr:hypothetical protein OH77DRAFT_1515590 [Trametes cingulata]
MACLATTDDSSYSESEISLETLFNRWISERWGQYLCLAGAIIDGLAAAQAAHELGTHLSLSHSDAV